MRIVVDTNVLVSAFVSATSSPARILDLWRAGDLEIVTSQAALDELQRVLLYPRIRTRLRYSDDQIDQFVTLLRKHALYLAEVPPSPASRPTPTTTSSWPSPRQAALSGLSPVTATCCHWAHTLASPSPHLQRS